MNKIAILTTLFKKFYYPYALLCYGLVVVIIIKTISLFINANDFLFIKEIIFLDLRSSKPLVQIFSFDKNEVLKMLCNKYGLLAGKTVSNNELKLICQDLQKMKEVKQVKTNYQRPNILQISLQIYPSIASFNEKIALCNNGELVKNNTKLYATLPKLINFSNSDFLDKIQPKKNLQLIKYALENIDMAKISSIKKIDNNYINFYLQETPSKKIAKDIFIKMNVNEIERSIKNTQAYLHTCFDNEQVVISGDASLKDFYTYALTN